MPNTREKLIEKINTKLMALPWGQITPHTAEEIADSLIEDGYVTDTNVGEWISVKERLPDKQEYDWVLVQLKLVPEDAYGVPCVAELRNGDWYDADGCWIGTDPKGGCVIVTHWMPLPEAPKGE